MNRRKTLSIAGVAVALLVLLAALPALAEDNQGQIQSLGVAYETSQDGVPILAFSWNTVPDTQSVDLQFNGGGVSDVWITKSTFSGPVQSGGKTVIRIEAPNPWPQSSFYYRLRARHGNGYTNWAQTMLEGGESPWSSPEGSANNESSYNPNEA
ncbi:MAG: hypothetical protein F4X87_02410 [Chloroflexi bacterium]|nr:hypothetical protein [Chloroflexota bacterium]